MTSVERLQRFSIHDTEPTTGLSLSSRGWPRCFGSEVYAAENGSYGIAALRRRHVQLRGDTVRFDFPGKGGKRHIVEER